MKHLGIVIMVIILSAGCRSPGIDIFEKKSPHDEYGQRLKKAGLDETAVGKAWFSLADLSLKQPVNINLPYKESGFFNAEKPDAAGYSFAVRRGELINISLEKLPVNNFKVFMDLWEISQDSIPERLDYTDSLVLNYEVEKDTRFILRLQPELLQSGSFTITIKSGPSLAFPVPGKENIQSYWGAVRDGGSRSHEGVDIFASRKTPVIAVADGRITRVGLNNLGGKVISMRPSGKNISLYYAHLDSQLVNPGQHTSAGDTIGLVGNTGNAISTSPHLHFGIYSTQGAIDHLPFIQISKTNPPAIQASTERTGQLARTIRQTIKVKSNENSFSIYPNSIVYIQAAYADQYRVRLPDSLSVYIDANQVTTLTPLRVMTLKENAVVYDQAKETALQIGTILSGDEVNIMGSYNSYYYITNSMGLEGWLKQ